MKTSKLTASTAPMILIYGEEGRGKTTAGSKFPRPLLFPFERGLPRGVVMDAVDGVDSYEGVLSVLGEIWTDGASDYDTLVFDGMEVLESLIFEHVCAENNWPNIEKGSYGKGYTMADARWTRILRAQGAIRDKHNKTIINIAHAAVERVDDPRTPTYTRYAPRLHKRGRALLMDAMDCVWFLADDLRTVSETSGFNSERVRASAGNGVYLFTKGKPSFAAKCRYGTPEKIPLPIDFDFSQLAQYWAN
jgi:AAA domain-containing protein